MATRTKGGLLLPLVIIVAAVLVFGGEKVLDTVTGVIGGVFAGTEIVKDSTGEFMVASSAKPKAEECTARQLIVDKKCGNLRVLAVDAAKMPFIARNTKLAWESGRPAVLTMNRSLVRKNRAEACPKSFPRPHGGSCDEYPMARTAEGGAGARTEEVPVRENSCQGGSYGAQYPKDGEQFLVIIIRPALIATGPFEGKDIAKEKGLC